MPVPEFKVLRIFRLLRVYRLLATLGVRPVLRALVRDRAGSALLTLLLAGIPILEFGSLQILLLEENDRTPTSRPSPKPCCTRS